MATLYEITADFRALQDLLENDEIDEQAYKDTTELLNYDLSDKAEGYAKILKSWDSDICGIDAEVARLEHRKAMLQNRQKRLEFDLKTSMEFVNKKEIKTPLFTIVIKTNPAKVEFLNKELIPEIYKKYAPPPPPTIDKIAIKKSIKNGTPVPGAVLVQEEVLKIK